MSKIDLTAVWLDAEGLPLDDEIEALRRFATDPEFDDEARAYEQTIGCPLPRGKADWANLVVRADVAPTHFFDGKVRPRDVLRMLAEKNAQSEPAATPINELSSYDDPIQVCWAATQLNMRSDKLKDKLDRRSYLVKKHCGRWYCERAHAKAIEPRKAHRLDNQSDEDF